MTIPAAAAPAVSAVRGPITRSRARPADPFSGSGTRRRSRHGVEPLRTVPVGEGCRGIVAPRPAGRCRAVVPKRPTRIWVPGPPDEYGLKAQHRPICLVPVRIPASNWSGHLRLPGVSGGELGKGVESVDAVFRGGGEIAA